MPRVDAGEAPVSVVICTDLGFPRGFQDVFEEGEQVGKGGFGVVKRVVKRATKQVLACKVLTKRLAAPDVAPVQQLRHLDTIKREVAVLKTLRGTLNVVHLDSVYEDDAHVYIVMEFCKGGEIWHLIGLRPYSEETAARIMRAALRTLAQCHARGILHRDIKPGNFLFHTTDEVSPIKAVDFGLAVFFDSKELPRRDLGFDGTPWFMAPEVLSSAVVPASDVWSAGVMAHQLLTGHLPFDDRKNKKSPALSLVWKSILSEEVNFRKSYWIGVSDDAKNFISYLLNKDPAKRPSAKEALKHPWVRKGGSNTTAQLSSTIVQRIQRYGQSSIFKRTVLDMIANELVQSQLDQASEGCDLPSARSMYSSPDRGGRSWHGGHHMLQGKSVPSHQFGYSPDHSPLKSPTSLTSSTLLSAYGRMDGRKRNYSFHDLSLLTGYNPEDREEQQRAVRLALDTSVHGLGQYPQLVGSDLETKAGGVDEEMAESPPGSPSSPADSRPHEPAVEPLSAKIKFIQFEDELAITDESTPNEVTIETGRRGQNLFGSFLKEEKQRKEQMDGVNQSGPSEDQHCPASGSVAHQQHMLPISSRSSKSIPILGAQKHTKRRQGGGKDLFNMLSGLGDYEDTKNVLETMHLSDGQPSTRKQLLKGFKDLGYGIEEDELDVLLESMAPSSTEQVNVSQFVASQLDWRHLQLNYHEQWLKCVQQAFESMDKDGDGLISSKDLVQTIGEKVPAEYVELSIEQAKLEACAEDMDMDFDGFVRLCKVDSSDSLASLDQYDSRQGLPPYINGLETVDEVGN